MSSPPLVYIDTCCINARNRAPGMDEVERLHAHGRIKIVGSTRLEDETRTNRIRSDKAGQYENRSEPGVWGVSRWGRMNFSSDLRVGASFENVAVILFPTLARRGVVRPEDLTDNQRNDVMHLLAAIHGDGSYFLTTNTREFVEGGRRESLEDLGGVRIRTPPEFLKEFGLSSQSRPR